MGAPKVTNSLLHPLCYLPSLPSPNIKNCSRGFIEFPAVVGGGGGGGLEPHTPHRWICRWAQGGVQSLTIIPVFKDV
jgi:hypothetical protein